MAQLAGKVALVTGAAVGIGRAVAVALGREGARVVVNYSKSRKEAEETASLVTRAGGESLLMQADVAQDKQVRAMVAEALGRFGRIDILVNNAGITAFVEFPDTETRWNVGRPNLEGTAQKAAQAAPLKRVGKPEDIADAALFLATSGDFMTGDVMVVDGGRALG